jgi:hypothetical protein
MIAPSIQILLQFNGLKSSDIGAHSIRKGAATFIANGSTAGPPYAAICIRLSWSMGVKDRYLHYNYATDAYCARILAGLDQNSIKFARLPAHTVIPIDFDVTRNSFPSCIRIDTLEPVRQFMLASLLYCSDSIATMLPQFSLVLQTYPFRHILSLKTSISVISGLSSPALQATGLPPHVLSWLNHQRIEDLIRELPEKVHSGIGAVLQANGVVAGNVTRQEMERIMTQLLDADRLSRAQPSTAQSISTINQNSSMFLWISDGRFHRLPESYEFPDLTVLQGFLLWFEGHPSLQLTAFRHLEMTDIPPRWRDRFSDLRCLLKALIEHIPDTSRSELPRMSTQELTSICLEAISLLPRKPRKRQTRSSQWKIGTALRDYREARVIAYPELKRQQRPPTRPSAPRTKRARR